MEKKYLCLKPIINMSIFQLNFVQEAYQGTYLKGNVYDFLADYNTVDKSDISNTQKYFMFKNDVQAL